MGELADQKVAGHGENGLRVAGCSDGHGVYLRRGGLWHKCSLVSNGHHVSLPCPIQTASIPVHTKPLCRPVDTGIDSMVHAEEPAGPHAFHPLPPPEPPPCRPGQPM